MVRVGARKESAREVFGKVVGRRARGDDSVEVQLSPEAGTSAAPAAEEAGQVSPVGQRRGGAMWLNPCVDPYLARGQVRGHATTDDARLHVQEVVVIGRLDVGDGHPDREGIDESRARWKHLG